MTHTLFVKLIRALDLPLEGNSVAVAVQCGANRSISSYQNGSDPEWNELISLTVPVLPSSSGALSLVGDPLAAQLYVKDQHEPVLVAVQQLPPLIGGTSHPISISLHPSGRLLLEVELVPNNAPSGQNASPRKGTSATSSPTSSRSSSVSPKKVKFGIDEVPQSPPAPDVTPRRKRAATLPNHDLNARTSEIFTSEELTLDITKSTEVGQWELVDGKMVRREYYRASIPPPQRKDTISGLTNQIQCLNPVQLWDLYLYIMKFEQSPESSEWARTFLNPLETICDSCHQYALWMCLLSSILKRLALEMDNNKQIINRSHSEYTSKISELQREITILKQTDRSKETLVDEAVTLRTRLLEAQENMMTLEIKLQHFASEKNQLEQQLHERPTLESFNNLKRELLQEQTRNSQMGLESTRNVSQWEQQISDKQSKIEDLEKQLQQLNSHSNEMSEMKSELQREKIKNEQLESQLNVLMSVRTELMREQTKVDELQRALMLRPTQESLESVRTELVRERTKAEHLQLQVTTLDSVRGQLAHERTRAELLDRQIQQLQDRPTRDIVEQMEADLYRERARMEQMERHIRVLQERPSPEAMNAVKLELEKERVRGDQLQSQLVQMDALREQIVDVTTQKDWIEAQLKCRPTEESMEALKMELVKETHRVEQLTKEVHVLEERPTNEAMESVKSELSRQIAVASKLQDSLDALERERTRWQQMEVQLQLLQTRLSSEAEDSFRNELRNERQQNAELKMRLREMEVELDLHKQKVEGTMFRNDALERDLLETRSELQVIRSTLDEERKKGMDTSQKLQYSTRAMMHTSTESSLRIEELEFELSQTKSQLSNAQQNMELIEKKWSEAFATIQRDSEQLRTHLSLVENEHRNCSTLSAQLQQAHNTIQLLQTELRLYKSQVQDFYANRPVVPSLQFIGSPSTTNTSVGSCTGSVESCSEYSYRRGRTDENIKSARQSRQPDSRGATPQRRSHSQSHVQNLPMLRAHRCNMAHCNLCGTMERVNTTGTNLFTIHQDDC